MHLSEHFTLGELSKSQTALRKGIKNDPDSDDILRLKALCENILEPVRKEYNRPITPSSGFRCLELNRAIGSSDKSQHVKGEAVDFVISGISNMEVACWMKEELDYDQLILEFFKEEEANSGWIHCSYVKSENRKKALQFDGHTWRSLE
jgi:zinc D-Ala-D-Ala carboxypeptidase|tara:strand:+ start:96 stop:542 length:447 start_codon:yes stop_codon:yes gene_type:complete